MINSASMCSAEYNRIFLNVLQDKGIDVLAWLQSASLDFEVINKSGGFMQYQDIEGFFHRHVEPLQIDGLGLAVGERTDISSHGSISHAVLSSGDFKEGLKLFERYMKLRVNFIKLDVAIGEQEVSIRFSVTENMQPYVKRFYLECAISGTHTFLHQFLKSDQFHPSYHFQYARPDYENEYMNRLGCDVSFNQVFTGVIVKREHFERNEFHGNACIFKLASQQCEIELAQLEKAETIVTKIKLLLMESPWLFPTQEQVAAQFAMSIRTLRRKLNEAGTTYQAVIDSVRESLAKDYLQNTQWTVNEIADLLGYSETNNFNRAFKRWSGHTPLEYRQQCRQRQADNLKFAAG